MLLILPLYPVICHSFPCFMVASCHHTCPGTNAKMVKSPLELDLTLLGNAVPAVKVDIPSSPVVNFQLIYRNTTIYGLWLFVISMVRLCL